MFLQICELLLTTNFNFRKLWDKGLCAWNMIDKLEGKQQNASIIHFSYSPPKYLKFEKPRDGLAIRCYTTSNSSILVAATEIVHKVNILFIKK